MKTPPPGTYKLDSPEVAKMFNRTPEEMRKIAENLNKALAATIRKRLAEQK